MNELITWLVNNPDFSVTFTLDTMNGSSIIVTMTHKPSRKYVTTFDGIALLINSGILNELKRDLALML